MVYSVPDFQWLYVLKTEVSAQSLSYLIIRNRHIDLLQRIFSADDGVYDLLIFLSGHGVHFIVSTCSVPSLQLMHEWLMRHL
jgi:hypothetical protein